MRRPMMSGWCSHPSNTHGVDSHTRCTGGNTANPRKEFQPCPCSCHYADLDRYECECGGDLVATPWENEDPEDVDEDGDPYPVYVHLAHDGSLIGQVCS